MDHLLNEQQIEELANFDYGSGISQILLKKKVQRKRLFELQH